MGDAREMLAIHLKSRDLISIGAYQAGSNPQIDRSSQVHDPLNAFLRQTVGEGFSLEQSWESLQHTMGAMEPLQTAAQIPASPENGTPDAVQFPGGTPEATPPPGQMP